MGMDVFGENPTDECGEYFRNNVWWWRPLWDYCCEVAPDIIDDDLSDHGYYNDGMGLNEDSARELGELLQELIAEGHTAEYEENYNAMLARLPRRKCQLCDGTGIRRDSVGISIGMPERKLDKAEAIVLGRTHGWCNACHGEGVADDFGTNYPFSVENVAKFAKFCLHSGGFSIC